MRENVVSVEGMWHGSDCKGMCDGAHFILFKRKAIKHV